MEPVQLLKTFEVLKTFLTSPTEAVRGADRGQGSRFEPVNTFDLSVTTTTTNRHGCLMRSFIRPLEALELLVHSSEEEDVSLFGVVTSKCLTEEDGDSRRRWFRLRSSFTIKQRSHTKEITSCHLLGLHRRPSSPRHIISWYSVTFWLRLLTLLGQSAQRGPVRHHERKSRSSPSGINF